MGNTMMRSISGFLVSGLLFFSALPSTTNYQLQSYGFGSGGTANSSTANYSLEGITGEVSGQSASTANYQLNPGYISTQQANVPTITLSNPSNLYDKLNFAITQNNPNDSLYALQVCVGSAFGSGGSCGGSVAYVKTDDTLGATLTTSNYQTYTAWVASGDHIIGLANNTTYGIRAKATQGLHSESAYGPSSSAATVSQQLSYCLYVGASCGSGNTVAFGPMTVGTIASSPSNIQVNFATNAESGGNVYVSSQYGAFHSTSANNYNLLSATADLSAVSSGYGAQVASTSVATGGPFNSYIPYNGSANNVGVLTQALSTILTSSNPLSGGTGSIGLKILPSNITPESTDYTDTLTLVAAASF